MSFPPSSLVPHNPIVPSVVGSGSLSFFYCVFWNGGRVPVGGTTLGGKGEGGGRGSSPYVTTIGIDVVGTCRCCVYPSLPPSFRTCVVFGVLCLCVKRRRWPTWDFQASRIAVATAEGNWIAPRIWTMPASAVNCDVVSGQLGGKKTKGLFLLYFCIYIDFLKDFPFSFFVSCSTFFGWSVPSTMNKRQKKNHKQILNSYHEGIIDRML